MNTLLSAPQETPDPDRNTPEALGALLANTRLERGLEQREVATRLGLTTDIVRALESGAFRQLEAPVFVRGYVTRYARLLGLPEQEILERYRRLGIDEHPPLRVAPSVQARSRVGEVGRWFSYLLILALVGWLSWLGVDQVAQHFDSGVAGLAKPDTEGNTTIALPQPSAEPPGEGSQAAPAESAPTATAPAPADDPAGAGPQTAAAPPSAETPAPATAPTPSAAAEAPASPAGDASLVLEFSQDCWVSITDAAGKRLAYGVIKAGTASTFSGPTPFTIALGNSSAVAAIKLNGQTVDPQVYVKRGGRSRFVLDVPDKST